MSLSSILVVITLIAMILIPINCQEPWSDSRYDVEDPVIKISIKPDEMPVHVNSGEFTQQTALYLRLVDTVLQNSLIKETVEDREILEGELQFRISRADYEFLEQQCKDSTGSNLSDLRKIHEILKSGMYSQSYMKQVSEGLLTMIKRFIYIYHKEIFIAIGVIFCIHGLKYIKWSSINKRTAFLIIIASAYLIWEISLLYMEMREDMLKQPEKKFSLFSFFKSESKSSSSEVNYWRYFHPHIIFSRILGRLLYSPMEAVSEFYFLTVDKICSKLPMGISGVVHGILSLLYIAIPFVIILCFLLIYFGVPFKLSWFGLGMRVQPNESHTTVDNRSVDSTHTHSLLQLCHSLVDVVRSQVDNRPAVANNTTRLPTRSRAVNFQVDTDNLPQRENRFNRLRRSKSLSFL